MKIFNTNLIWLILAIILQTVTAKWCTRMGRRTYNVEVNGNETKTITRIEKFCCEGYVLNGTDCKPVCPQDCPHGTCVEPNKCLCNEGYVLQNSTNICEPFCSTPCGFGKCTQPETCECDEGHALNSTTKQCEPVCTPQCPTNSKCLWPNHCECDRGYGFNETTKLCDALCQRECVNARCAAPDSCECFLGYTKDSETFNVCRPNRCTRPCHRGYCDTKGDCHCYEGYIKSFFVESGNTYCEAITLLVLQSFGIFLIFVLIIAIIIFIIVKAMIKKGTYHTKETEQEFKQKISVK